MIPVYVPNRAAASGNYIDYSADTPVTYGSLKKYVRNESYNPIIAKAVKGGRRRRYGRRRFYRRRRYYRRYRRGSYRGRGGYMYDPGNSAGANIGGYLGSKAGEYVGGAAQGLLMSYSGLGAYQVKGNALMPGMNNPNPHGGLVIRGCEYLCDIISGNPGTFTLYNFPIQAALEQTFPKLAQIAANYDQYVIEGMYFEFKTMSADALNSTNTALGQVVMCTNYNVAAPLFKSKQAMEEYDGGVSVKPSDCCKFFIECARSESPMDILWTRSGALAANQDIKTFDLGNFQIATNGLQGTDVNVGELWVTYQVALLKPKLFAALGNYADAYQSNTTPYSNAAPLGNNGVITVGYASPPVQVGNVNGPGASWVQSGNAFVFPNSPLIQSYKIQFIWTGTVAAAITYPVIGYNNCSLAESYLSPDAGETAKVAAMSLIITSNPQSGQAFFTVGAGGTLPSGTTNVQIEVFQIPNQVYQV